MEFNTVITIILGLLLACMVGLIMFSSSLDKARKEVKELKDKVERFNISENFTNSRIDGLRKDIEDIKDKQHQLACKEEALHNYLGVVPVWVATDETLEELQVAIVSKKEGN